MLTGLQQELQALIDEAKGTYGVSIYHFESQTEFFQNADEWFYAASIIKVPIMAAVFDQAFKGNLRLEEKIALRAEDMVTGSGLLQHLSPGLELSIYDYTVLMIIDSDNTATNILIDRIGTKAIQDAMKEWGLEGSGFFNKLSVIPAKIESCNKITPRDMTHLLKLIAEGKVVSWRACNEMVKIMKQQKYNEGLPSLLPKQDGLVGVLPLWECAHKTGWVTGTEHDMGLLYFPGNTFAVSVFGKDIADRKDAHQLMGRIGRLLYDKSLA
jgi:beta-lactamase class A